MGWHGIVFVNTFTLLPPILHVVLHLSGHDLRTLPLAYLSLATIAYVWFLANIAYPFFFSPLNGIPQPPGGSFFLGHAEGLMSRPPGKRIQEWIRDTPNDGLIHFRAFFHYHSRLIPTTPETLAEVLNAKAYDWHKPAPARRFLTRVLGRGLVCVEGQEHKIQRRSVAPAFQGKNIRDLVPTFWAKSKHFADVVASQMELESSSNAPLRTGRIELNQIASRMTLDIIGKAALGKDMNTVVDPSDELAQQYALITDPKKKGIGLYLFLNLFTPQWFIRRLPYGLSRRVADATVNLRVICRRLIAEKKAAIAEKNLDSKDILSVLIRSGQFDDDGLVSQLLTFIAAGHDTTSNTLSWASYLLALHADIQTRLRHEIQSVITESGIEQDSVTAEQLDSMPFLQAVCNEVLRMFPTVPVTSREAIRTTYIGDQIVPKGTQIMISPSGINKLPSLWGPDAAEFNPDRWMPEKGDPATGGAANRYSFLTFLHGPRSCIGQGFALTELKCLLACLLLRFDISLVREEDKVEVPEAAGVITVKPKEGMHLRLAELYR